jgi:hypothetical protein
MLAVDVGYARFEHAQGKERLVAAIRLIGHLNALVAKKS